MLGVAVSTIFNNNNRPPVVSDTFTRADSAVTMGNAETGQLWTPFIGTWGISGGKAYVTSNAGSVLTVVESGISDGKLSVLATWWQNTCLVFRCVDVNNFLILQLTNGTSIVLQKYVNGVWTILAQSTFAEVGGLSYHMCVVLNGSNIDAYVDGVKIFTVTESFNKLVTKHGLRLSSSDALSSFDNFIVEVN